MNPKVLWSLRVVILILLLCWMGMIFAFSAQDGQKSSGTSEKVCRKVAEVTVKDFQKLPGEKQNQVVRRMQLPVRKGAHMSEYSILALLFSSLFLTFPALRRKGLWMLCSLAGGFLYASGDELHQRFISGRAGQFRDVLIDMTGFTLALFLIALTSGLITFIRKKRNR